MDYEYYFISKIVNIAICKETQLGLEQNLWGSEPHTGSRAKAKRF